MINIVVTEAHPNPIRNFLRDWTEELRVPIELVTYEGLATAQVGLSAETIIFADIERLSSAGVKMAAGIARKAKQMGKRVLNEPGLVLTKFDLLMGLHQHGINDFAVYRVGQTPLRWPVFVRSQHEHGGDSFPLLHDKTQLEEEIDRLSNIGKAPASLLIVEYVDAVCADGLYRNYSILRIGDRMIPRHLFFSDRWVARKTTIPVDEQLLNEERIFDQELAHTHMPQIKQAFDLANIEYGRVDYALVNGKIQIWEINTHPQLISPAKKVPPDRVERASRMAATISRAFNALEPQEPPAVKPLLEFKPSTLKEHVHVSRMPQ